MSEFNFGESLFKRVQKYFGETAVRILVGAICLGIVATVIGTFLYVYNATLGTIPVTWQATVRLVSYVIILLLLMIMFQGYLKWQTGIFNLETKKGLRKIEKMIAKSRAMNSRAVKSHSQALQAWNEAMELVDEVGELVSQTKRVASKLDKTLDPELTKEVERKMAAVRQKKIERRRKKKKMSSKYL